MIDPPTTLWKKLEGYVSIDIVSQRKPQQNSLNLFKLMKTEARELEDAKQNELNKAKSERLAQNFEEKRGFDESQSYRLKLQAKTSLVSVRKKPIRRSRFYFF